VQWSSTAGEAVPRLTTEAHGSDETGSQRGSFRLSPLSSDLLNEIAPADAVALVQQARAPPPPRLRSAGGGAAAGRGHHSRSAMRSDQAMAATLTDLAPF
jgi:hypothetical protein